MDVTTVLRSIYLLPTPSLGPVAFDPDPCDRLPKSRTPPCFLSQSLVDAQPPSWLAAAAAKPGSGFPALACPTAARDMAAPEHSPQESSTNPLGAVPCPASRGTREQRSRAGGGPWLCRGGRQSGGAWQVLSPRHRPTGTCVTPHLAPGTLS